MQVFIWYIWCQKILVVPENFMWYSQIQMVPQRDADFFTKIIDFSHVFIYTYYNYTVDGFLNEFQLNKYLFWLVRYS